jgi:hypothetical protein
MDKLAVLGLFGVTTYMYFNSTGSQITTPQSQSAEREVDPRRWAHNGSQPINSQHGNGISTQNPQISELYQTIVALI